MDRQTNPIVTLAALALDQMEQGTLYKAADVSFGTLLGLKGLGISYNEVPAGKASCPFHNHHVEDELFVILEGEGTYRFGDRRLPFKAGDVLGAPAGGRETAHQILNTGEATLRYIGVSTKARSEIVEYPDSNKYFAFTRMPDGTKIDVSGRADNRLDYWDGEPGA